MKTVFTHGGRSLFSHARRLGSAALATIALAACTPGTTDMNAATGWLEAGSPKALEVDRAQYRHTIFFQTDRDNLVGAEQDRLIAFLRAVRPTEKDSIRIEGHADERASDLYNLDLAARRMETVGLFLKDQGIKTA